MDTRELIERLRAMMVVYPPYTAETASIAATTITSQAAEIERLREALAKVGDVHRGLQIIDALASDYLTGRILECREIADAALTPKPNKEGE